MKIKNKYTETITAGVVTTHYEFYDGSEVATTKNYRFSDMPRFWIVTKDETGKILKEFEVETEIELSEYVEKYENSSPTK